MLKLGAVILSIWGGLNLLPSFGILVLILFQNKNAPALSVLLSEEEITALSADAIAAVNSIAAFANGLNVVFCLLFLIAIWKGLNRKVEWVFWALLISSFFALMAGIAGDYVVGTQFPEVNVLSGLILVVGFICSAVGIFKSGKNLT